MLAATRIFAACLLALLIIGCRRLDDSQVVGTWRYEDDTGIDEMTLNADHSISALSTSKHELSTPSVFEARGTWRIDGAELKINAALVYTPNDWKTRTGILDRRGALVMRPVEGTKACSYQRYELPGCRDGSTVLSGQSLREDQMTGTWKMHFNTHDSRIQLRPDGKFVLLGFILGKWDPLWTGNWRIEGPRLAMRGKDPFVDSGKDEDRVWLITFVGQGCFSAQDEDGAKFSLVRLSESELVSQPAASPPAPSSPLSKEEPSPEH